VVRHHLAKVDHAGSSPVAYSNLRSCPNLAREQALNLWRAIALWVQIPSISPMFSFDLLYNDLWAIGVTVASMVYTHEAKVQLFHRLPFQKYRVPSRHSVSVSLSKSIFSISINVETVPQYG
jgi:hypothetical protein